MRLLLLSHAQTDWNVAGRFQGHTDIPLNDHGHRQALAWQQQLAREPLDQVWSSDLLRAAETAETVAKPHGLMPRMDQRLRELSFGAWEGLTYAEIEARHPAELAAWRKCHAKFSAPGGETLMDMAERLRRFARDLDNDTASSTVLVVAHRGALRTLLCVLLEQPVERQASYHLEIASLSELTGAAAKWTLRRINETLRVQ